MKIQLCLKKKMFALQCHLALKKMNKINKKKKIVVELSFRRNIRIVYKNIFKNYYIYKYIL